MLISLAILLSVLKNVTGVICRYYPSNNSYSYTIECKFACCDGYPKTINTTCCDIDDYNVFLSWVIPVSIIFGTIGLCCLCACMCCFGCMIVRCCDECNKSTVRPIISNQPPLRPSVSNSSVNINTNNNGQNTFQRPSALNARNLDRLPELPSRSLAPRSLNLPTYDELNNITIRTDAPPRYETFINRQL